MLRDDGTAGRWFSPLALHVLPKLGGLPVSNIDQVHIRDALAPIWRSKAPTARKAMDRLGICMKYAAAEGLNVDIQAVDKAKILLGDHGHKVVNIPSIPWKDVPGFYASLNEYTPTQLALRLLLLTALRSKPVRFCRIEEIEGNLWTVPAANMKGAKGKTKDFRVPLSAEALAVIEQARPFARDGFLFPSTRKGVLSDATMSRYMERRRLAARPHGFRTSFRTWCAEATDVPHEVAEMAIAHETGSKVVKTYRQTDFLEQRQSLMERWADHVTGGSGKIVKMAGYQ